MRVFIVCEWYGMEFRAYPIIVDRYTEAQMKLLFECLFPLAGTYFAAYTYIVELTGDSPDNVPAFIEAVKKREKTLSGFGHRQVLLLSLSAAEAKEF